jgi:hypothetical protein
LEAIPGKQSVDLIKKTALLGTSHIVRKVLQSETGSLSGWDRRWFRRSTGEKGLMKRQRNNNNNNNNNNNKSTDVFITIIRTS